MRATDLPCLARETARLAETVDFPTPPFPEITEIMFPVNMKSPRYILTIFH
jgi:hypothetical protein